MSAPGLSVAKARRPRDTAERWGIGNGRLIKPNEYHGFPAVDGADQPAARVFDQGNQLRYPLLDTPGLVVVSYELGGWIRLDSGFSPLGRLRPEIAGPVSSRATGASLVAERQWSCTEGG